jgi:hypothetical protein
MAIRLLIFTNGKSLTGDEVTKADFSQSVTIYFSPIPQTIQIQFNKNNQIATIAGNCHDRPEITTRGFLLIPNDL